MEWILVIVFFSCFLPVLALETVTLSPSGEIRGKTITTRNGREISAYLGIPYAESPVGPNRFKTVGLKNGWDGVLPGDEDGHMCPQLNDGGQVVGDEDCLYLNVYTPETKPESAENLYPTMVYFHGGAFVGGSGSSKVYGPEYLLDRDIVLVTVNYRLGALGFLSTGDTEAPGNFGLKDQVIALQWVKKYIEAFGGAASSVTLFGHGAGGVSSNLHGISDISRNLFHRYISQSGNALNFWAFDARGNYKKYAMKLGKRVNCLTENTKDLVDCLRTVNVEDLVDSNDVFRDRGVPFYTWVPTNEHRDVDIHTRFIIDPPFYTISARSLPIQPAIIGNVRDEGLQLAADFYVNGPFYRAAEDNLTDIVDSTIRLAFSEPESATKIAQNFYFGNSVTDNKETFARNMSNFMSDMWFRNPTKDLTELLYYGGEPLFAYEFDYRGTYSETSKITRNNDNVGVTHGDELNYIFPGRNSDGALNDNDELMIDMMLDFWTSFASTGTPASERATDPWELFERGDETTLRIGDNSDTSTQSFLNYDQRLQFWDAVSSGELEDFAAYE